MAALTCSRLWATCSATVSGLTAQPAPLTAPALAPLDGNVDRGKAERGRVFRILSDFMARIQMYYIQGSLPRVEL